MELADDSDENTEDDDQQKIFQFCSQKSDQDKSDEEDDTTPPEDDIDILHDHNFWRNVRSEHKIRLLQFLGVLQLWRLSARVSRKFVDILLHIICHFFSDPRLYADKAMNIFDNIADPETPLTAYLAEAYIGILANGDHDNFDTYFCCTRCSYPYHPRKVRILSLSLRRDVFADRFRVFLISMSVAC